VGKFNRTAPETGAPQSQTELLQWTSDIVAAYLNKNEVELRQIPQVVTTVYSILSSLGDAGRPQGDAISALSDLQIRQTLAHPHPIPVERSVTPDYIVCLEDGVRLKTLKRYLFRKYRMTPDQYREKWGLQEDYPMVAPSYAAKRSALAKKMGLGQKRKKGRRRKTARKEA